MWRACCDCGAVYGCYYKNETLTCHTCNGLNCPEEGSGISHGLCADCFKKAMDNVIYRRTMKLYHGA